MLSVFLIWLTVMAIAAGAIFLPGIIIPDAHESLRGLLAMTLLLTGYFLFGMGYYLYSRGSIFKRSKENND